MGSEGPKDDLRVGRKVLGVMCVELWVEVSGRWLF